MGYLVVVVLATAMVYVCHQDFPIRRQQLCRHRVIGVGVADGHICLSCPSGIGAPIRIGQWFQCFLNNSPIPRDHLNAIRWSALFW